MTKLSYDELIRIAASRQITSRAQLNAYLDHDQLECLICGKSYTSLGAHITPAHGCTVVEYKRAFNIPRRAGLLGKSMKEHLQDLARSPHRIEECRALGQIYGPGNGGARPDNGPEYSHHTRGNTKGVEYSTKPDVVIPQSPAPATEPEIERSAFFDCLRSVIEDVTSPLGQAKPPLTVMQTYDEHSAMSRLARVEGVLEVIYRALKEYFRE